MRSMSRAALPLSFWATLASASGCAGVPWGAGGAEPTRATAGAVVRAFDAGSLAGASERLAARVAASWSRGVTLARSEEQITVDWSTWSLTPGAPRLALSPERPAMQAQSVELALSVVVPLAGAEHEIELTSADLDAPCRASVLTTPGELTVPMSFVADKLGRVQGVVVPGASYRALSEYTPNLVLSSETASCAGLGDVVRAQALAESFAAAAAKALGESLSVEVPIALGLDLAFAWSTPVSADALGTGFLRVALRGVTSGLVRTRGQAVQVAYALTMEADAHPCMGPLTLPEPRAELTTGELPAGAALHIEALERVVGAAWLAGAVCADHLGAVPVSAADLAPAWPALGPLLPEAELSLEVWPAALPRLKADPDQVDGLVFETGRLRADLIATFGGVRWRAASVELDLSLHGALWVEADGAVLFDPGQVDVRPISLEPGLLDAPDLSAVEQLVPPLVEALVIDRVFARLPPVLAPATAGSISVDGVLLTWAPGAGQ